MNDTDLNELKKAENTAEDDETPKKPLSRIILENVLYFGGAIIFALLFVRFVAVRSVVEGPSMLPFVENNDNIIVEKISYYFHAPERFDVVVFELKDQPKVHYIKRIIGLPGETVEIREGRVYIDGKLLEEDTYCSELISSPYTSQAPVVLGDDEYFVMGDNRNHSKDSRSADVGPIQKKQFLGKAWIRFWPFSRISYVGR